MWMLPLYLHVNQKYNYDIYDEFCFFMHLFLKILSGLANGVDPDQTAPLSETLVFKILGHLPYSLKLPQHIHLFTKLTKKVFPLVPQSGTIKSPSGQTVGIPDYGSSGPWFKSRFICLFVLRFYSPVNPMGSCHAWSICLTILLLDRLSPLSG